ncbi:MAG TPA: hypothetical protein VLC79_10550 [Cellvibrio sp.]|nr:hypothetical protein [Cellvibrio sp.]
MTRNKLAVFPVSLLFLCCSQVNANQITGSLSAESLLSDNTLKQTDNPVEERQDIYRAGLAADYSNWLIDAEASYQWFVQTYADHTQEDENYGDGSAQVVIGKKEDPVALDLSHSRHMLLSTPDAVGLIQNQQEREILSARPEIRKRVFSADRITLGGQLTRVKFPENELQDSKRNGVVFGWTHPLSQVSVLQAVAQQQEVSFDHSPLADYTATSSMLAYGVELRKLKYGLELGYNESDPETGEKYSAPTYKASAAYQSGFHLFNLSANRSLTDTSFGNGNMENSTVVPDSDGLSADIDRIDRINLDLTWQTQMICDRCVFSVGVTAIDDDYLEKDEKSLSLYTHTRFSYALSTAASIALAANKSDVDFDNEIVATDYTLSYLSLEYGYQFSSGVNIRLAARNEDRNTDSLTGDGAYKENSYSIGLGYNF